MSVSLNCGMLAGVNSTSETATIVLTKEEGALSDPTGAYTPPTSLPFLRPNLSRLEPSASLHHLGAFLKKTVWA